MPALISSPPLSPLMMLILIKDAVSLFGAVMVPVESAVSPQWPGSGCRPLPSPPHALLPRRGDGLCPPIHHPRGRFRWLARGSVRPGTKPHPRFYPPQRRLTAEGLRARQQPEGGETHTQRYLGGGKEGKNVILDISHRELLGTALTCGLSFASLLF